MAERWKAFNEFLKNQTESRLGPKGLGGEDGFCGWTGSESAARYKDSSEMEKCGYLGGGPSCQHRCNFHASQKPFGDGFDQGRKCVCVLSHTFLRSPCMTIYIFYLNFGCKIFSLFPQGGKTESRY